MAEDMSITAEGHGDDELVGLHAEDDRASANASEEVSYGATSLNGMNVATVETAAQDTSANADVTVGADPDKQRKPRSKAHDIQGSAELVGITLHALKKYFLSRLVSHISNAGGNESLVNGWNIEIAPAKGAELGIIEVSYIDRNQKVHANIVDVLIALCIYQRDGKSNKTVGRAQLALQARDTLERLCVSQLLVVCGNRADEVKIEEGIAIVTVRNAEDQKTFLDNLASTDPILKQTLILLETDHSVPRPKQTMSVNAFDERSLFSFGSMTVLTWGQILSNLPAFHTPDNLYPLGFKCIRLEYDVMLNRVVECLCEIGAVPAPDSDGENSAELAEIHGKLVANPFAPIPDISKLQNVVPLFRVTVGWIVGSDSNKSIQRRVYEGSTPEEVWQAAMTETLGLHQEPQPIVKDDGENENDEDAMDLESLDAEELALRKEVVTKRQQYFTAVRSQQIEQSKPPLPARLSIDETTSLVDSTTARLMEGMQGSVNCEDYIFYGNRNVDTGLRKEREKGFGKQHVKAYSLTRAVVDKMSVLAKKRGRGKDTTKETSPDQSPIGDKGQPNAVTTTIGRGGKKIVTLARSPSPSVQAESDEQPQDVNMRPTSGKGSRGGKFTMNNRGLNTGRGSRPSYRGDKDTLTLQSINNGAVADNIIVTDDASAYQKDKAKEFERIVRNHRENFASRDLKKRLNKSKVILQQLCDREEIAYKEKLAQAKKGNNDMKVEEAEVKERPLAPHNIIKMPGRLCTPILEIWEFMSTFHKTLKIKKMPTIEHMTKLFKSVDPIYSINDYLPLIAAISTQATIGVTNQQLLIHHQRNGIAVLTEMCRTLATVLRRDYEKLMGMDSSMAFGAYGEENNEACIPVNILTWQEIAYVSLVGVASKECGNSDNDTLSNFKGKGYNHTPDNADKRLLSLVRKRILFKHQIRDEYQESVYGFTSGVISKLPSPPMYNVHIGIQWRLILLHLVHDFEGWYIYDIISKAYECLDGFNESKVAAVRKVLYEILYDPQLSIEDMFKSRKIALALVQKYDTGASEEYVDVVTSTTNMAKIFVSNVDTKNRVLPASVYSDLVEKETNIVIQVSKISGISLELNIDRLSHIPMKAHVLLNRSRRLQECQAPSELVTVDEHNRLLSVGLTLAEQNLIIAKEKEANAMSGIQPLEEEEEENGEEGEGEGEDEDDGDLGVVSDRATRRNQPWRYNNNYTDVLDEKESTIAALLPLAAQRCYTMISELMKSPTFFTFNYPVDNVATPQYYQIIPQPLCLYDIRRSLLRGAYNNNLTAFYKDMILIFENASSYNPENTAINAIAYKCVFIFERQFLERVLSWDFPLASNQYCNQCKSTTPPEIMRRVICERCDSQYHMACCVPQMYRLPKGDWICFNCVEQRDVAAVHPNKNAVVSHPDSINRRGEVVGIEQIHQTLTFVVSFSVCSADSTREEREMWNAAKVRKQSMAYQEYLLEQICAATGESRADFEVLCKKHDGGAALPQNKGGVPRFNAASDIPSTLLELYLCREHWTPRMVEGYDIDDFDEVCNYARGYANYGASHSLVPVHISDGHNIKAKEMVDPAFETYRAAIATLSTHSPTTIRGSDEWLTLIRSLVQRVMLLPEIVIATNEYDTEIEIATKAVTKLFENGAKGIDTYVRPTELIYGNVFEAEDTFRGANDVALTNVLGTAAVQVEQEQVLGINPMELEENEGAEVQDGDLDSLATVSEEAYVVRNANRPRPKYAEMEEDDIEEEVEWEEAVAAAPIKTEGDPMQVDDTEGGVEGIADLPVKKEQKSGGAEDDDTISETSTVSDFIKLEDEMEKDENGTDAEEMGNTIEGKDVAIIDTWDEEELRALATAHEQGQNNMTSFRELFQQIITKLPEHLQSMYPRRIEAIKRVARKSFHPLGSLYYISEFDALQLLFELRRLSRLKGRDDALYYQTFVGDLMESVSNFTDTVEESQQFSRSTYDTVLTTIIKSCVPKVSDSYDVESWTAAWKAAINSFYQCNLLLVDSGHSHATHIALEESRTCAFCEQQECYLGSHFVRGESWDEWEARMDKREAIKKGILEEENLVVNYKEKCIAHLRFKSVDAVSPLGITVQSLDSWLDAAKNGQQWQPLNDDLLLSDETDIRMRHELESLHTRMYPPAAGSLVVHECCMENLHQMRLVAYERSKKRDDARLISTLVGIGRSKTSPLGYDRHGNRYWVFPGIKRVYVSQRDAAFDVDAIMKSIYDAKTMSTEGMTGKIELYNQMSQSSSQSNRTSFVTSLTSLESTSQIGSIVPSLPENAVSQISDKSLEEVKEHFENMTAKYLVNCGVTPSGSVASNLIWSSYESFEDIQALIQYLDTTNAKERQLRRILLLLYPEIEAGSYNNTNFIKEESIDIAMQKEEQLIETEKKNKKDFLYKVGDVVDVRDRNSSVLWTAEVLDVKKVYHFTSRDDKLTGKEKTSKVQEGVTYTIYYQVQYDNWPEQYKVWTVAECMQSLPEANDQSMDLDEESLSSSEDSQNDFYNANGEIVAVDADKSQSLLYKHVCNNLPDPISSLRAASFLQDANDQMLSKINYSDATIDNPVAMMRCALLTVYAALPYLALDEHEERWGKDKIFHGPWIEAVAQAKNATDIMQCLLILEISIKNSYRKAAGTKIMQCLSSRLVCLRRASIGLAALRLWCLDASIRYDKKSLE